MILFEDRPVRDLLGARRVNAQRKVQLNPVTLDEGKRERGLFVDSC